MSDDKKGFESSMEKLEKIVNDLEKGEYSLEESVDRFEEGIKLGKACKKIIDEAEAKVKTLVDNGELREETFDVELPD